MALLELFKYQFKEKYNSDPHFADHLLPEYKSFEQRYNDLLKPRYPSITDEMKRQLWLTRKLKLDLTDLNLVDEGIRQLLATNFENVALIKPENEHLVQYLREKSTQKIYKVSRFTPNHYHYAALGDKSIISIKFDLHLNLWKSKVIVKYSQGFLSETAFMFATYGETKQNVDAKVQFDKQAKQIDYKLKQHFNLLPTKAE